jgi:hypothetical protein
MKHKEIFKLILFSVITASVTRYITICVIWESMKVNQNNFHKNLTNVNTYQQKIVEIFYLELITLFVFPYFTAIVFYFFSKINLRQKNNFLVFILLFTVLFFLSYFLIGYIFKILK